LLLVIAVTFEVIPFRVHARDPAFLPLQSTDQTNILELHVEWSVIVPEFHTHPGNNTLLTVISFSETRINHEQPNPEGG
jgi:hypothetical protein